MKKEILGVKIDDVTITQTVQIVKNWLSKKEKYYITTPNPELIVLAQRDEELKSIINNSDLAIPDGNGLKLSGDIVCNTPGIDVMEELVKVLPNWGFTAGFLGGKDEVAKKTAECLRKKYPKLKVTFADSGGIVDEQGVQLNKNSHFPQTDVLFVAFGQPKQEKWIAKNLDKLPIKVAMGVGGSFDYITGNIPRAPGWVRDLGFEWLFRLMIQPRRIKRQLRLLKFVWLLAKGN